MIVKVLGVVDIIAALSFLMLIFGIHPFIQIILFSSGLLFMKGMFILTGDVLSVIDLFSSLMLILSIFFTLPAVLIWIPAFLLLAKGFVSFF